MFSEAANMHFVNNGLRRGSLERRVAFPIVGMRIHHDALHRPRGIVTFVSGSLATVALRNYYAPSVWVEKHFGRIEAHSTRRIEFSINSISVDLPCFHAWHEHVPIVICAAGCRIDLDDTRGPGIIDAIKQEQLDRRCVL